MTFLPISSLYRLWRMQSHQRRARARRGLWRRRTRHGPPPPPPGAPI